MYICYTLYFVAYLTIHVWLYKSKLYIHILSFIIMWAFVCELMFLYVILCFKYLVFASISLCLYLWLGVFISLLLSLSLFLFVIICIIYVIFNIAVIVSVCVLWRKRKKGLYVCRDVFVLVCLCMNMYGCVYVFVWERFTCVNVYMYLCVCVFV